MPAVTPDSTSIVHPLRSTDLGRARPVRSLTTAPGGFEGEGFPVRRAFAGVSMADLDPFVHMDQMGEVFYQPGEPKGTPWHPHRGFETVTYMLDGLFVHRDSIGGGGSITDGDTQWMTAGKGILHIEQPPEEMVASGGLFHGVQLWVNLPSRDKWVDPRYQDLRGPDVTLLSSPDGGALARVIAGDIDGHQGPGGTHTPIAMVHATLQPGAELDVPWDPGFNALVYALAGNGRVGEGNRPIKEGQLAVLGTGDYLHLRGEPNTSGDHKEFDVLLLGGRPIAEPVVHYGPFVMNTRDEIAQALADFQAGRMGTIPA